VKRVYLPENAGYPASEDHIIQVGNYRFPGKDQPQFWAQVQLLRKLIAFRDGAPDQLDPEGVRSTADATKDVLVTFCSPTEGQEMSVWCRLRRLPLAELVPSVLWFFVKLGLFSIGALVFWKRPSDRSAALFFLLCIVTLGAYMGGYHWTRIATQPLLILPFMVCAVLMPPVSLHFYLSFPQPKAFVEPRPWWTVVTIYGIPAGCLAGFVISYAHLRAVRDEAPENIARAWDIFGDVVTIYLTLAALWYLASVVALLHSYRTAQDATERNQVQ